MRGYEGTRRFGIIVPSVNTVLESEFGATPIRDASFHYARVRAERSSDADILTRMAAEAPTAARLLADARPEKVVFACTSGSLVGGRDQHCRIAQSLEQATAIPSTTTLQCAVDALRALRVSRPALVTPYLDWVTAEESDYLRQLGFDVQKTTSLGISDGHGIASLQQERIVEAVLETVSNEADGVFLSCTNLPTFGILRALEEQTGIPVVSSNSATLWGLVGETLGLAHLGRLFGPTGR